MLKGSSQFLHFHIYCSRFFSLTGETVEHLTSCVGRETTWSIILYTEHSSVSRCNDNRMTQKYQGNHISILLIRRRVSVLFPCRLLCSFPAHFFCPGSYIQAAEKSFSMVKGGRAREAAALAWERQGAAPDKTSFKNWAKSVLENPAVVDFKVH